MEFEFWDNCWQRKSQPFHLTEAHPFLVKFLKQQFISERRVLVPLSGKSVDQMYLAEQGYYPVGIEFNATAVQRFIEEHELDFTLEESISDSGKPLLRYVNPSMEIWLADFFELRPQQLGHFCQVYDRAAMIALPEKMRSDYAQHLQQFLLPGAILLLVTMDYDPDEMSGPPFFLSEKQLQTYFPQAQLQQLSRCSLLNSHPRWQELALSRLDEVLYQIKL